MPPLPADDSDRSRRRLVVIRMLAAVLLVATIAAVVFASIGGSNDGDREGGSESRSTSDGGVDAPTLTMGEPMVVAPTTEGAGAPGAGDARTLVLYDATGAYGWLGELYAIQVANLSSHFGSWTAQPVSSYRAGQIEAATATVYVGSTYDEPLPTAFLDDVGSSTRPIIWINHNIWQLADHLPDFHTRYGWQWKRFDTREVDRIDYQGVQLDRSLDNDGGIMSYAAIDETRVATLATAVPTTGKPFPWALRSGRLTYVGEIPFGYTNETDRSIIFEDLLFDALDPGAKPRHRAVLRLEDVNPTSDPADLRAVADALRRRNIPYGIAVVPRYLDPKGIDDPELRSLELRDAPAVQRELRYMLEHGGTLVQHGFTHQYSDVSNPYNGITGDDFEFFRVTEDAGGKLTQVGPTPDETVESAGARMDQGSDAFEDVGLSAPTIFEFPHYIGSVAAYQAAAERFDVRWDRGMYFAGTLRGGRIDYRHSLGQSFPYVVRDVYGTTVLPENLGNYAPVPFHQFQTNTVAEILRAGSSRMVVRDGVAGVYYHPFEGSAPMGRIVDGLEAQGWTFVEPASLVTSG